MNRKLKYWLLCSTCIIGTIVNASEENNDIQQPSQSTHLLVEQKIDIGSITKKDLKYPVKPDFMKREDEEQGGRDNTTQTIFKQNDSGSTLVAVSSDLVYCQGSLTTAERHIVHICQFYAQSYVDKKLTDEELTAEEKIKLYFDEYTNILRAMGWIEIKRADDSVVKTSCDVKSKGVDLMIRTAGAILSGGASAAFELFLQKISGSTNASKREDSLFQYFANQREITQRFCDSSKEKGELYLDVAVLYFTADNVKLHFLEFLFGVGTMNLTQYVGHSRFILNMEVFEKNRRKIMDKIPHDQWMIYDLL